MNSPLASRSRRARAFTLLVMVDPLARQVDRAGPAAAVLLRSGPADDTVFVARHHRARRVDAGLIRHGMIARDDHLRAGDLDGERLVAGCARPRARPRPGPAATGHLDLHMHREVAAAPGR